MHLVGLQQGSFRSCAGAAIRKRKRAAYRNGMAKRERRSRRRAGLRGRSPRHVTPSPPIKAECSDSWMSKDDNTVRLITNTSVANLSKTMSGERPPMRWQDPNPRQSLNTLHAPNHRSCHRDRQATARPPAPSRDTHASKVCEATQAEPAPEISMAALDLPGLRHRLGGALQRRAPGEAGS